MRRILLVFGLVVGCALFTCGSAFAWGGGGGGGPTFESLTLDTYSPLHTGAAGPVSTTESLTNGEYYVVTVQGTWSAWEPQLWTGDFPPNVPCGTPEPAPMFPSPVGNMTGPVGQDAETVFAAIEQYSCQNPYPRHDTGFQMNLGSGFANYDPIDGPQSTPSPNHLYIYVVKGQGSPISFEQLDSATGDNYGEYHINVFGGINACQGWGWWSWFKSQNDCQTYFTGGGHNCGSLQSRQDPTPPWNPGSPWNPWKQ